MIGVLISIYFNKKQLNKQNKVNLIKNVIGYSYQLTLNYEGSKDEIIKYLNQIFIVFNNSKQVIMYLKNYKKSFALDDFINLLKSMCDVAGIYYNEINDSFLENPFCNKI